MDKIPFFRWLIDLRHVFTRLPAQQRARTRARVTSIRFLSIFFTFFLSCNDNPSTANMKSITLAVEDVTCTEAFLRIRNIGLNDPMIILRRDDAAIDTFTLSLAETLCVDEGLAPSRTYSYEALVRSKEFLSDRYPSAQARTMDTTSHEFTWEVTTLGDGGSSVLYDVAIINDTLAYAVGEIYMAGEATRYNAAKWNGSNWSIQRIPYNYEGQLYYHPIQAVFAFGSSDIWFCGNGVSRWDGTRFIEMPLPGSVWGQFRMNKLWGSSSNDMYVVGDGGSIAHYNGTSWRKVESGTTVKLTDISSCETSQRAIVCGSDVNPYESICLSVADVSPTILWANTGVSSKPPFGAQLQSLCMLRETAYLAGSGGVFRWRTSASIATAQRVLTIASFPYSIRSNRRGELVVAGDRMMLWHFNGLTWRQLLTGPSSRPFLGVAMSDNLIIAVGVSSDSFPNYTAQIAIGRR